MNNRSSFRIVTSLLCACVASVALCGTASAQHGGGGHGGGGGGGHGGGGGGGHSGYGGSTGYHGGYGGYHGGYHGGYGGYGGYRGGHHGGYGGYYGWHGGYGWRGGYYGGWGPWGWGGLGLGLYFATLPYYYTTYYWGGVPYYYANNTYYRWDPAVGQYQTVSPPTEAQAPVGQDGDAVELIAYPKNAQSAEQQNKDKFECHRWAVGQTGFDPTQPAGGAAPGNRGAYFRAQGACLEGRGYSVK